MAVERQPADQQKEQTQAPEKPAYAPGDVNESLELLRGSIETLIAQQAKTIERLDSVEKHLQERNEPTQAADNLLEELRKKPQKDLKQAIKAAVDTQPDAVLISLSENLEIENERDGEVLKIMLDCVDEKENKTLWAQLFTSAAPKRPSEN